MTKSNNESNDPKSIESKEIKLFIKFPDEKKESRAMQFLKIESMKFAIQKTEYPQVLMKQDIGSRLYETYWYYIHQED